jgi:ApbE superfamily uncharacterized protein (UPF0280 family)
MSSNYEPRFYRQDTKPSDLISFEVVVAETDLHISAERDMSALARTAVIEARFEIESFIQTNPVFATTYRPYPVSDMAPLIVCRMAEAAAKADVGPMAAVAGAVAEYVGRKLMPESAEVIVENGGDIFIVTASERRMAVYAGQSPLSNKIVFIIKPEMTPLGICTSSGTVGHSKSFGRADAAVVMSPNTALADAWATALGNMVHSADDLEKAVKAAQNAPGLTGALVIKDDKLSAWGSIEIEPLL